MSKYIENFASYPDPGLNFPEVDKPYHRANPRSSFRPILCFAVELQSFVCDHAPPPTIEKLWSEGIAMHMCGISVYYTYTGVVVI